MLAIRLEDDVPLSLWQNAFRRGEGLSDNVCILRSALRDRTRNHRPIFVTFTDVAKAFDSVSHESMIKALGRAGVPVAPCRDVATGWTGVDMSIPLLPEVVPEIDVNPVSFFLGRRAVGHGLELD